MEVQQQQAPREPGLQQQHMQQPPARTAAHLLPSQQVGDAQKQHTQASQHPQPPAEPGQQKQEAGGEEQPKKRRRRRKGVVGDINVALYIKQQQSRGSSRKWRQEWVSVRTIIGGGEVKMLKWVTDTPPAAPTTSVAGFANFQGFAQSRPRKPAATTGEGKDTSPAGAERQQQGKQGGALSRLGSTTSLDQATAGAQPQQPPKKKSKKQQQQPGAAGSAVAGPASTAATAGAAAGAATTPPGTDVYLPLPHPKRKRTTARRPAAWFKTCGEFPPAEPVTVAAASASTGGRAALPAAGSAGGAAGPGQDIKSLAASIAASIAADVHADTSGSPAVTAAGPGPGPAAAGAAKGSKKRKSAAAAAAAAGPGGGTDAAGEGAGAPAAAAAAAEHVMVGPPGAQRFACSVCGRDFATQGALRIHSNVHATKNFACTFPGCKKAFADAKKLEKHAKKHAAAAAVLADTAAAAATGSGASGAAAASASEA